MNPSYYRPVVPHSCRRAPWHDYRSRCIYMITMNRAKGVPCFSYLRGTLGSHSRRPHTILSPLGEVIASCISALKERYPFVRILRRVIMPEHIHFVLFITEDSDVHLGDIIKHLKVESLQASIARKVTPELPAIFEELYHDRILIKRGQLQRLLGYVSDNPRRRMERMRYPDFHHRRLVSDEEGRAYEAYGNIHLLEDPDIEAVRVSSHYSEEELQRRKRLWLRTIQNSGVLASPFISEAEKRVRDWACSNGGRLILLDTNGFGKNYAPKEPLHTLCSEGRLLIIAPTAYSHRHVTPTRTDCLRLNDLATAVAEHRLKPLN